MAERFSASHASKHLGCHASANLELAIPGYTPPPKDGNTAASIRGTAMHEIMELAGAYTPKQMLGLAKAMEYVAELRMLRRFKILLEAKSSGWWLDDNPPTTADVVLHVADEIHVVDYKFGTIPVDVNGNEQGKYYSAAFLPLAPKAKGVWFHIVQPFADNIEHVFFSRVELDQFMDETRAAEKAIAAGSTTFTPGDHCTFCPANPHTRGAKGTPLCPAMLKLLYPPKPLDEDSILDLAD